MPATTRRSKRTAAAAAAQPPDEPAAPHKRVRTATDDAVTEDLPKTTATEKEGNENAAAPLVDKDDAQPDSDCGETPAVEAENNPGTASTAKSEEADDPPGDEPLTGSPGDADEGQGVGVLSAAPANPDETANPGNPGEKDPDTVALQADDTVVMAKQSNPSTPSGNPGPAGEDSTDPKEQTDCPNPGDGAEPAEAPPTASNHGTDEAVDIDASKVSDQQDDSEDSPTVTEETKPQPTPVNPDSVNPLGDDDPQPKPGTEAAAVATGPSPSAAVSASNVPEASSAVPSGLPPMSMPVAGMTSAVSTNPEAIIEERAELPAIFVGKVLGKGGDMIRDLQARSSCRIDVDQNVPPGSPRIITYRGTRSAVDFAKYLIQVLSSEQTTEADLPLGNAAQKNLVIPASSIGKVIGRGGEMVRSMQSRSQARIQIDHSGAGLDPTMRSVKLTGTHEAVVKAEEMILFLVANPMMDAAAAIDLLVQDKMRGGVWGSGPPYPSMPNQGQGMSGYASDQGVGYGGGYGGGYGAAQGAGYQAPTAPYAGSWGAAAAAGATEAEVFLAPKTYMGRIIGSKGVTVNDLQSRSGCDIQINQDVPPGQDCQITIRGSRQGIEMTKQMLREIIESGPNHPYAGGGQQGGYGGYNQGGYGQQQQAYGYQAQPAYGQPQYPAQQYQGAYQGYQAAQPYASHSQMMAPPMQAPGMSAWKSASSADGQVYYYNEQTGETQWEKPPGMP